MSKLCGCGHRDTDHKPGCRYCVFCIVFADSSTEHTAKLCELADIALRIGAADLKKTGSVEPFFVLELPDGKTKELHLPAELGNVMNIGFAKDLLFGLMREQVQKLRAVAAIFVSDGYITMIEDKPPGRMEEVRKEYSKGQYNHLKRECLMVSVQTPARSMMTYQLYDRNQELKRITLGEVRQMEMPVDQLEGRQKMFGDLNPEKIR